MKTVKEDGRPAAFKILYPAAQLTWGIVQNILGFLLFLLLNLIDPKRKREFYHGAIRTDWKLKSSMGLGMFIFFGHHGASEAFANRVLVHEYGHTVQSCILGPLFLPVIGIPSFLWAFLPVFVKRRRKGKRSYFDFYPERWANREGERVLKLPAPES